jgi:hypothetical protein
LECLRRGRFSARGEANHVAAHLQRDNAFAL